ncbi:LOW QUALITY PROTEIN: transcriptional regulator ovo [Ooceraea biroi]|uniref:LOW QUALITY PROTEIN: transcriptional regulator ovo n=1 Tax=Ooceraea biroi TaxID=2015173 RepID=UPI000F07958B|nr:LOW QUALITY PROTEIN: transcriptional regulator ovo [Ooceraea biroi]
MPKIFLIKNRLHQQQLRLLESQHLGKNVSLGSARDNPLDSSAPQPLSLIVNKDQYRDKPDDDRATSPESLSSSSPTHSPLLKNLPVTPKNATINTRPRRFFSSILNGESYGSRLHVLTRAERKDYSSPPIASDDPPKVLSKTESEKVILPRPETPPKAPHVEPPTRVSVIQRVPPQSQSTSRKEESKSKVEIEKVDEVQDPGPVQEQPIDYAVPKRKEEDDEKGRDGASVSRNIGNSIARSLLAVKLSGSQVVQAASRHSDGSSGGSGNAGSGSSASSNNGGGGGAMINGCSSGAMIGCGGGGGGGAVGGGAGAGGMPPGGNGGRGNYGPSSPPTGSLPPFYESLKGGNNLANFANQYNSAQGNGYLTPLTAVGIECDTGQQDVNSQHAQYNAQEGKQYSLLQNVCANVCASYGLTFKEEEEELAAYKIQTNDLLSGQYGPYDVTDAGMMVDMVTGAVMDPLQFTAATLTFNSPPDHTALLESLSDAADLLLPRLQTEDGGSDLLEESLHSPASTGSSGTGQDSGQMTTPVEPSVDPFPEHSIALTRGFDTRHYTTPQHFNASKLSGLSYAAGESSYQSLQKERPELALHVNQNHQHQQNQQLQIQVQLQQHQQKHQTAASPHQQQQQSQQQQQQQQHQQGLLSPGLSFAGNGLELDSGSSVGGSLPSPGTTSCSLDGTSSGTSPSCALADSHAHSPVVSPTVVNAAQSSGGAVSEPHISQRLGLPSDCQIEFVNGGHGIKNPLAVEGQRQAATNRDEERVSRTPPSKEDDPSRFSCRVCSKNFSLQRLLNRHMKCHSDVKRYLCTFCGKGFNDTFDLKRHTRTHTGVRPYKCYLCEKSFTQRCSLESHGQKVHGVQHQYAYKERRAKMYVCEECGHTTHEPEVHYIHLKEQHPYSPALLKFYDKRHFKFTNSNFANMLLQSGLLQRDSRNTDSCGLAERREAVSKSSDESQQTTISF